MSHQTTVLRPTLLGLALLCATAGAPARADDTILRLSESATVLVPPDELTASLRAETAAPTAQDAQRKVNDMMREAVAAAKKIDGVTISTGGYNVWRTGGTVTERAERWQAGQTLNVTGKDPEAMLRLIGDLQQKGLAQGTLAWRLSRDAEKQARRTATKQALSALRGRADEAAEILGLKFSAFREVRLDSVLPPPIMPRGAAVSRSAMMAAAPPPTAEAEDLPVNASAEADIVLKPR